MWRCRLLKNAPTCGTNARSGLSTGIEADALALQCPFDSERSAGGFDLVVPGALRRHPDFPERSGELVVVGLERVDVGDCRLEHLLRPAPGDVRRKLPRKERTDRLSREKRHEEDGKDRQGGDQTQRGGTLSPAPGRGGCFARGANFAPP